MEKYPHYLERLQAATRKYWDKPALNNIGGESFTYAKKDKNFARADEIRDILTKKGIVVTDTPNGPVWSRN